MSRFLSIIAVVVLFVYTVSAQYTCQDATNCNNHGACVNSTGDWYCVCDDDYATHPEIETKEDDSVYCNYQRKKQLTAFLLAWFLGGFGGGQWYLGLTGLAVGKLILGLSVCCIIPCVGMCLGGAAMGMGSEAAAGGASALVGCCYCCCVLGIFVWWLVDIIHFGMNSYDDKDGVALEPW